MKKFPSCKQQRRWTPANHKIFKTAVDMENETGGENQKMPMTMAVFCNELLSQLILSEEYSFLMQVCRRG